MLRARSRSFPSAPSKRRSESERSYAPEWSRSRIITAKKTKPFIHLDDLTDCIERTVELRNGFDDSEIFLVAQPELMSYEQIQEQLGELIHGKEWPSIRIPKVVAKVGAWPQEKTADEKETFIKPWMIDLADDHYPVAIDHVRGKLEWARKRRLRDTFPEMVRRLKDDPAKWYEINGLQFPEKLQSEREIELEGLYRRK